MAILKQATTVSSQTVQPIKPISTQTEAIAAQLEALASVEPRSLSETAAVDTQQRLLRDYASIQPQQATVESRFTTISAQQVYTPQVGSSFTQLNPGAQIRALATATNRESLVAAVRFGVDMWRLQAHFQNITITAVTAIGTPGCLTGPALGAWIVQAPGVRSATGYWQALVTAVANAVSGNFSQWQSSVMVPGLPWYPTFAAFPGPFAPPMPNIPMPLIACVAQHSSKLTSAHQLGTSIKAALSNEFDLPEIDQFLDTLSVRMANYFMTWLASQQVMMVMGMGPVPTYAPPFVPVGPVVAGYIIPSPGHLAA